MKERIVRLLQAVLSAPLVARIQRHPKAFARGAIAVALVLTIWLTHSIIGWNRTSAFAPAEWLQASVKYRATIRRDNFGVPHITGRKDTDVAFGAAYAQASDALEDLEYMVRLHRGQMGLAEGPDGVPTDWLVHLLGSVDIAEQHWGDLSEPLRDVMAAFADGLNYYALQNQDLVDHTLYPVTGKDILAASHFQQIMFYGFADVLQQASDGRVGQLNLPAAEGSNAIAISPGRGWGATRLLINSHQPLDGPLSWYEMRLESGEGWDIHGGTFPGSPFIYLGATPSLGWGATVNKPRLVQFYKLELHADDPRRYRYKGSWWDMTIKKVNLPYKLLGNFYWSANREIEYSKHGPVVRNELGVWAMRYAGAEEYRQIEQWFAMNKATNRDEWMQAMRIRALPSLNFVYADAEGNISYIYNAMLRELPAEALDKDGLLEGTLEQYLDLPMVPFDSLPAVHNPRSGWVVSVNQTPFYVTGAQDNPQHSAYLDGLGIESTINNRALRAVELLGKAGPVTAERLLEIKYDKRYSPRYPHLGWLDDIRDPNFEPGNRLLEDVQRELSAWDMSADAENPYAGLGVCMVEAHKQSLAQEATFELKAAMTACAAPLSESFGSLIPEWGELLRLRRGEQSWPLGGAPDMLRAIYYRDREGGDKTAVAGDGLTLVAEWDRTGALSLQSIHQYGSSRDPESPHYADQAPIFAEEKMRPAYDFSQPPQAHQTLKLPY